MKVTSPAGDFEITVKESSVEGDFIVISGQMGVWDSHIYMKPSDLLSFAGVLLTFRLSCSSPNNRSDAFSAESRISHSSC